MDERKLKELFFIIYAKGFTRGCNYSSIDKIEAGVDIGKIITKVIKLVK